MRIRIVGGGPGGLYAALLLKKDDSSREIDVFDRNPPDATYGWGVVFSDETLSFLGDADPQTYGEISRSFVRWEAIDIFYGGDRIRSGGHAFSGLSRKRLLSILQERCRELGVRLHFEQEVREPETDEIDLVVAADGLNSSLRQAHAGVFKPSFDVHRTRFIWLGVSLRFEAFTFVFRGTEFGMFQVHAYPFERETSTFIVECTEDTWKRAGLDRANENETLSFCEELFGDVIAGQRLLSNRSTWINFVTLRNETWRCGNVVLLGDAAHTAHFSIGSGTKMAMEDAIALRAALQVHGDDIPAALLHCEELRQPVVERTQQAARESSMWFENTDRYARFQPTQFAFSLLTRSKRITYENLKVRDPDFTRGVDAWFAAQSKPWGEVRAGSDLRPRETPYLLRNVSLAGRVAATIPPAESAVEGVPGTAMADMIRELVVRLRLQHRLVLTQEVAVSAEGRITLGCPGLYTEEQAYAWLQIVQALRATAGPRLGVRLNHAGRRGATRSRYEGIDVPLPAAAWPLASASPIPYTKRSQIPREMSEADMDRVCDDFVRAAELAARAGFDLLELCCGHGYLLGSFISPLSNRRTDGYGGSLDNRLRYPLRVAESVRRAWPEDRPMSVSLSILDWLPGGLQIADAIQAASAFGDIGCDLIHVLSGQTTADANPSYGRVWQAALSDAVRNEAEIPTMVGGGITNGDEVDTIVAAGRADLCVVGRTWTPEAPALSFMQMVRPQALSGPR